MKYLTTKESAEQLGISVRTLRRWVKSGKLVPEKKGDIGRGKGDKFSEAQLKKVTTLSELQPPVLSPLEIQIPRRMDKMVVPIDKLSGHMWNYPADEYKEIIIDGDACDFDEKLKGKSKSKDIRTTYWLELAEEYKELSPLTPFHREILFACMSAYEQGIRYISYRIVARTLAGSDRPDTKFLEEIKAAVEKLMKTHIRIDIAPLLKASPKYRGKRTGDAMLTSPLLPCKIIEAEINGQKTLTIELLSESPLMEVAKIKEQVTAYKTAPLAIAELNDTPRTVTIKNWLLRRINLMKSEKRKRGLNASILFQTLYEECGLADADKGAKRDARKVVFAVLDSFKADGVIRGYEIERDGNLYRSIKVSLGIAR